MGWVDGCASSLRSTILRFAQSIRKSRLRLPSQLRIYESLKFTLEIVLNDGWDAAPESDNSMR